MSEKRMRVGVIGSGMSSWIVPGLLVLANHPELAARTNCRCNVCGSVLDARDNCPKCRLRVPEVAVGKPQRASRESIRLAKERGRANHQKEADHA